MTDWRNEDANNTYLILQPQCNFLFLFNENLLFQPLPLQLMKFFSLIFSFFLLYISCLPCGDPQECNEKALQSIAASASHQDHQHSSEACTPFCSCACCAASVVYQPVANYQHASSLAGLQKFPIQKDSFLSQKFSAIWQPPKIS